MRSNAFFSRTARRGLAAGALSLGLLGSAFAAGIQVTDAWIRWLPANLPAGGYAKVTNDTDKEIKLVGASSPKYGMVMLHQTVNKNGMSNMVHVDAIAIAPHKSMAFTPGDYHIMLMQPKPGIEPGQKVPVTLKFTDGQTVTAEFEVRKPTASGPGDMKGMDMDHMHGMQH
ncbi:MAG: copper chaperone PCu(A)C [Brachymonas sp.]|nr:copper chaperone PCu(A)C [Betaproteobacteria bacterium]MDE2270107.1 copper chaperone PCu(A)C [Betaproteobacteria bacterium]